MNWELSWLDFNVCVFVLVVDKLMLLFECVKFLVIFVFNFDEFYMVWVVGFKCCDEMGLLVCFVDGLILCE